jgi:hypothetical protein
MDDGVRALLGEPVLQDLVILRQVDQVEMDLAAGLGMPDPGAFLDRIHRRERLHAKLGVDPAPRQVVDDVDLMPGIGKMQRCRPADETVAAHDCNLHW